MKKANVSSSSSSTRSRGRKGLAAAAESADVMEVYKAAAELQQVGETASGDINDSSVGASGAPPPSSTTQNIVIKLDCHPEDASSGSSRGGEVVAYNESDNHFSRYDNSPLEISGDFSGVANAAATVIARPTAGCHHCMWCCHPFIGPPVGIPVNVTHASLTRMHDEDDPMATLCNVACTGNFCSYECAAAYNFSSECGSINHRTFERYCLLNALANGSSSNYVLPAPDRWTLDVFGGTMDIEQFRKGNKHVAVHHHPLIGKQPQLEEIHDDSALLQHNRYVPASSIIGKKALTDNEPTLPPPTKTRGKPKKSICDSIKLQVVSSEQI